jgi:hypothetical protein
MSSHLILPFVAYLLVASPASHKATRSVLGSWVATPEGTAKLGGLLLHGIVFILLVSFLMRLFPRNRSNYGPGSNSMQAAAGPHLSNEFVDNIGKGFANNYRPASYS